MTRNKIFILSLSILLACVANAQQGTLNMNLSYSLGVPVGGLKNSVSDISPRGWQAQVMYGINKQLSVGLGIGYQDFYQKYPRQLYKSADGSDISAVRSLSIQPMPILASARYSFSPENSIQPFVGLGLGGSLVMSRDFLGEFVTSESSFGFAAKTEAGVYIPFRKQGETGFTLAGAYNYMPYSKNNIDGLSHFTVAAGIRFALRR